MKDLFKININLNGKVINIQTIHSKRARKRIRWTTKTKTNRKQSVSLNSDTLITLNVNSVNSRYMTGFYIR